MDKGGGRKKMDCSGLCLEVVFLRIWRTWVVYKNYRDKIVITYEDTLSLTFIVFSGLNGRNYGLQIESA